MISLLTFGGLRVEGVDETVGVVGQPKRLGLLAVIASTGASGISRDQLLALFWPESDRERARNALKQALFTLRRDLGDQELVNAGATLQLTTGPIRVDVVEFDRAIAESRFEDAVSLYRGPFLDGVHIGGAAELERWIETQRARREEAFRSALDALAVRDAGNPRALVRWRRRLAEADPHSSRTALALMRALAELGDVAAALAHGDQFREMLRRELELEPDLELMVYADSLRASAKPAARDERTARADRSLPLPTSREGGPPPVTSVSSRRTVLMLTGLAAFAIIAAIALGIWWLGGGPAVEPPRHIAVRRFTVVEPELSMWTEGMPELLARSLDGAGLLYAVPPAVVARVDGPERLTAAELARAANARFIIEGGVVRAGRDSIRVTATVFDARRDAVVEEISRSGAQERIDQLIDAVAVAILERLGGPGQAAGGESWRSPRSVPALKAFLRGEELYRRTQWDSARHYLELAVREDTGFVAALWRLGKLIGWTDLSGDSLSLAYRRRAGSLNHGLGAHDSLLVVIDSLSGAIEDLPATFEQWPYRRRLLVAIDRVVTLYPNDVDARLARAEALYHYMTGPVIGASDSLQLEAFRQVIAIDPSFGPAYLHMPELYLNVFGRDSALAAVRRYLRLRRAEETDEGMLVLERVLPAGALASRSVAEFLDTAFADGIYQARTATRRWPDVDETSYQMATQLQKPGQRSRSPAYVDSARVVRTIATDLAYRGHLRQAGPMVFANDIRLTIEIAFLGGFPDDSTRLLFERRLQAGSGWLNPAMAWYSEHRDTAALNRFLASARERLAVASSAPTRLGAAYDSLAARAHLSLARGDSADALRRFVALPDTICSRCYTDRLVRARLLARSGRGREAFASLTEQLMAVHTPTEVMFALERARVATKLGLRSAATRDYCLVARAWRNADPPLKALAEEARSQIGHESFSQRCRD